MGHASRYLHVEYVQTSNADPLLDGLVVLVPGLGLPDQALVDLLKPVRQDGELLYCS